MIKFICMGFMDVKKITLLFLFISALLLSTSFAARQGRFVQKPGEEIGINAGTTLDHGEEAEIHERLLKVNTKDYGRYDPAPALVKPPFKFINN